MSPDTQIRSPPSRTYRVAKRIAIGVAGGSVLVVGIAMIILPGPAFVVIPVGLGILSLEFAWARSWLDKVKARAQSVAGLARKTRGAASKS